MGVNFSKFSGLFKIVKEGFSEPNGSGSFGRLGAGAIVFSTLVWVTYVVLKTHVIPDLSGPSLFLSTGTSATYGANKLATALKDKNGPDSNTNLANVVNVPKQ